MGVYGIGIDMVRIDRMEAGLVRWGDRFLEKVFTAFEKQACGAKKNRAACFALRFRRQRGFRQSGGNGGARPALLERHGNPQ